MLPPLTQMPEPWHSIHEKVVGEMGQEWADRWGEASLRAAAFVMGDDGIFPGTTED